MDGGTEVLLCLFISGFVGILGIMGGDEAAVIIGIQYIQQCSCWPYGTLIDAGSGLLPIVGQCLIIRNERRWLS